MVFQKYFSFSLSQDIKEDATKSSAMNYGSFLYITYMGNWDNYWSHSYTPISQQNQQKTTVENGISTKTSHL